MDKPNADFSEIIEDLDRYVGFYIEQILAAADPAAKAAAAMAVCAHYESLGMAELL